jgi:hypothetical protein
MSADGRFFLYKDNLVAGLGDVKRCLHASDPTADYHGALDHGDRLLDERLIKCDFTHYALDDLDRFLGSSGLVVLVHPGALLADIGHLEAVGIEPHLLGCFTEGRFMQLGRAGSYDHAGQTVLLDGIFDHILPGLGAHVFVLSREGNLREFPQLLGHLLHIHTAGNVFAAVADENTYFFGWGTFHTVPNGLFAISKNHHPMMLRCSEYTAECSLMNLHPELFLHNSCVARRNQDVGCFCTILSRQF